MTDTAHTRVALSGVAPLDIDLISAEVEKGQQLAGHFPSEEALERGRRIYRGEVTLSEARAELDAKYSRG